MKQDSLSAMLEAVRIRGSVYFWTSFGPPWGVQVPQFERDARWLGDLLQYISREVIANGPGTSAIVTRLSEILFVQTLRSHVAAHPDDAIGWAGFVDPHLGPALARIHEAPGTDWSLAALARTAGLSRTRFAVRFRDLMGQTPFEYVARWRMTCAKTELRRHSRSIADTARDLGYRSEAAFNRAFTKRYGIGPGAFRRSLQPGVTDAAPAGDAGDGDGDAGDGAATARDRGRRGRRGTPARPARPARPA